VSVRDRRRGATRAVVAGVRAVRSAVATAIWVVAVVCALILALGALVVALRMNQSNEVVSLVLDGARRLDLGRLKTFTGKDAAVKAALVDWGVAAVVYLVVGRILDRLIRP
jgi:anti-sigma-K factor RskA